MPPSDMKNEEQLFSGLEKTLYANPLNSCFKSDLCQFFADLLINSSFFSQNIEYSNVLLLWATFLGNIIKSGNPVNS